MLSTASAAELRCFECTPSGAVRFVGTRLTAADGNGLSPGAPQELTVLLDGD